MQYKFLILKRISPNGRLISFDVDDDIRFTGEAIKYKNIKQGIKEAHQGKVEGGIFIYVYKNKVLRISSMSS